MPTYAIPPWANDGPPSANATRLAEIGQGIIDAQTGVEQLPAKKARVATTANITLSATQTIDGVAVIAGDRVLAKNQTTGSENGIYTVAAGAWSRPIDADSNLELYGGVEVAVAEGTANGGKVFALTNSTSITVGTTALTFQERQTKPQADANYRKVDLATVMTDLKAVTGMTNGELRYARGRAAAEDGGGGLFRYDTSLTGAEDATPGMVFKPTGFADGSFGRWIRVLDGAGPHRYSVMWWGAKADDDTLGAGTDSTAAVLACSEYIYNNVSGRGIIFFPFSPSGGYRYKITSSIDIKAFQRFEGEGSMNWGPEICYYGAQDTHAFQIYHFVGEVGTTVVSSPEFVGLRVRDCRTGAAHRTGTGIFFGNAVNNSLIQKVMVIGFQDSIYVGNIRPQLGDTRGQADLTTLDEIWFYNFARYGINAEVIGNTHRYRHILTDSDDTGGLVGGVASIRIGTGSNYGSLEIDGVKHEDRVGVPTVLFDTQYPPMTNIRNLVKSAGWSERIGGPAPRYTGAVIESTGAFNGHSLTLNNIVNKNDNAKYILRIANTGVNIPARTSVAGGNPVENMWHTLPFWCGGSGQVETSGYWHNDVWHGSGNGSPEGTIYAPRGSQYSQRNASAGASSLWLKTSGDFATNTGWTQVELSEESFLKPAAAIKETVPRSQANSVTINILATGRITCFGIHLTAGQVINNIVFCSGTTAATAPTNQWFALYSPGFALLRATNDDTSTAWTASTMKSLTLSSSYTVPTSGIYYVGICVVATTPPSLVGSSSSATILNLSPSIAFHGQSSLTNPASAPNPVTPVAGGTSARGYAYVG